MVPVAHTFEDITATYDQAADLVQGWGARRLECAQTVAELLTFDGVSLWDVVAPSVAINKIAPALLRGPKPAWRPDRHAVASWSKRLLLDRALGFMTRPEQTGQETSAF